MSDITPYVTPAMLLSTNVGISWTTFPKQGASGPDQIAAQLDICNMVTSEMDTIANQTLRATLDVEQEFGPDFIITILPNGWARFRLSHWPILQLVSAQCSPSGAYPPVWTTIPQTALITEHSGLPEVGTVVPSGPGPGPTAALIAPGYVSRNNGRKGYLVQVTSVNGFPSAGINATAAAGATSIHVDDVTGWWDPYQNLGARGRIYDPPLVESVQVTGMTPDVAGTTSGPGTLTLPVGLQFTHAPKIGLVNEADQTILITTMPRALIQSGYFLATYFGLMRGSTAAVMQVVKGTSQSLGGAKAGADWYAKAEAAIARYARVY